MKILLLPLLALLPALALASLFTAQEARDRRARLLADRAPLDAVLRDLTEAVRKAPATEECLKFELEEKEGRPVRSYGIASGDQGKHLLAGYPSWEEALRRELEQLGYQVEGIGPMGFEHLCSDAFHRHQLAAAYCYHPSSVTVCWKGPATASSESPHPLVATHHVFTGNDARLRQRVALADRAPLDAFIRDLTEAVRASTAPPEDTCYRFSLEDADGVHRLAGYPDCEQALRTEVEKLGYGVAEIWSKSDPGCYLSFLDGCLYRASIIVCWAEPYRIGGRDPRMFVPVVG